MNNKLIMDIITIDDEFNLISTAETRKKTYFKLIDKAKRLEDCIKYIEINIQNTKNQVEKDTLSNIQSCLTKIIED